MYTPKMVNECVINRNLGSPYFSLNQEPVVEWAVNNGYLLRSSHTRLEWTKKGAVWYHAETFGLLKLETVQVGKARVIDCTVSGGCLICGKKVKNPKHWAHLLTNGNLISDDQGFFPVGPSCARKIGKFALKN